MKCASRYAKKHASTAQKSTFLQVSRALQKYRSDGKAMPPRSGYLGPRATIIVGQLDLVQFHTTVEM
ncbi:hypothetical protein L596_004403 [Steinernema carpocapsae]|uniref:Uncharacterized protein n=1 Tax=Steinernema carpocapsae TaxID=34508 RepID=A0A4U8UVL9_STECR|nr:hypothetical protein L596_004403 [Steinernema carpocapsae]